MRLGGVCLAAFALLAGSAAAAGTTPAQLVTASMSAANKQRSVHYVSAGTYGGSHVTIVGDSAPTRGVQHITFKHGTALGRVTVVMLGRALFIRGDKTALTDYMGFTPQQATQVAGSWVAVSTTAKGYTTIAAAVELRSTISELAMPGTVTQSPPSTRGGTPVVAVHGRATHSGVTVVETLYVRPTGAPLPVAQVSKQGSNTSTVTFSRWNETVSLATPAAKFFLR
jgi:hypothetical protein